MSRWFRFYAEAMRNPKVLKLSDRDFRLWVRLLAIASENDGRIPCDDDLKAVLMMRLDHLSCSLKRLASVSLIDVVGGGYVPHNWDKYQYNSDTSTERVRKYREKRNVSKPLHETAPDTDTDTEVRDSSSKVESERPREGLFGNDAPEVAPPDSLLADVMEEMGMYTVPADAGDMLKRWRQEGCDPKEHILPAIKRVMERVRYRGADRPVRLAYFHRAVIEERDREAAELAEYKARMQAIAARYSKPADERVH